MSGDMSDEGVEVHSHEQTNGPGRQGPESPQKKVRIPFQHLSPCLDE